MTNDAERRAWRRQRTSTRPRWLQVRSPAATPPCWVLDEGLLHTPYSVAEGRAIYELAQRDETGLAELRRDLRADAGYMSRIVARLEADGLVTRSRSATDARRQVLVPPSRAGPCSRRSTPARRLRSASCSRSPSPSADGWSRRWTSSAPCWPTSVPPTSARSCCGPGPGDYGWVVARHGALYADEYGWDTDVEGLVARIVSEYIEHHDPAREAAWVAEVDGEPAGCVLCVARDTTTAQLRILLVEPRPGARHRHPPGRPVRAVRPAGRVPLDHVVDQRRAGVGLPHLRGRRVHPRRRGGPPQLRA